MGKNYFFQHTPVWGEKCRPEMKATQNLRRTPSLHFPNRNVLDADTTFGCGFIRLGPELFKMPGALQAG